MGQIVIVTVFSVIWIMSGTLTAIFTGFIWGEFVFITSLGTVLLGWWKSVKKITKEYQALAL